MVFSYGWPKLMDLQAGIVHSRAARRIETGDLDRMTLPEERLTQLPDALGRTTMHGIHRGDYMEQFDRRRRVR